MAGKGKGPKWPAKKRQIKDAIKRLQAAEKALAAAKKTLSVVAATDPGDGPDYTGGRK